MSGKFKQFSGQLVERVAPQYGPYLEVTVPESMVSTELVQLRNMLGEAQFTAFTQSRLVRDGEEYHITVVDPLEMRNISVIAAQAVTGKILTFDLLGLGKAEQAENTAYFVVAESGVAQAIRAELGLAAKDFHLTLGFLAQDIHNVAKDRTTLMSMDSGIFEQHPDKDTDKKEG